VPDDSDSKRMPLQVLSEVKTENAGNIVIFSK
jgi:hypothetical protein